MRPQQFETYVRVSFKRPERCKPFLSQVMFKHQGMMMLINIECEGWIHKDRLHKCKMLRARNIRITIVSAVISYVIQVYKVNQTWIKLYRWIKLNNIISYYTIVYHTRCKYIYISHTMRILQYSNQPSDKVQKVRMLICIITPNQKCSKALSHSYDGILISWLVKISLMYSTLLGSSSLPPCPRKYCLHK